jgi:hypothetical protein
VLADDPEVGARLDAFRRLPHRLDGTGAAVGRAVDELLGLIDAAADRGGGGLRVMHLSNRLVGGEDAIEGLLT